MYLQFALWWNVDTDDVVVATQKNGRRLREVCEDLQLH